LPFEDPFGLLHEGYLVDYTGFYEDTASRGAEVKVEQGRQVLEVAHHRFNVFDRSVTIGYETRKVGFNFF
jgi:hypothetical protein